MITLRNKQTGQLLYLEGAGFNFVNHIGDVQDLTKANMSFSTNFKVPASFNNVGVLKGLGLIGSTSDIPYRSRLWDLLVDDITIIRNAELIVTDMSSGAYNAHLKQGVVSFFKDIQADTISEAIDLSELEHENNMSNVIDSWKGDKPYKYIIADYNNVQLAKVGSTTNLSKAGIHPSLNVKWLWDKIFKTYGWTYELTPDLSELWLTYPTALDYETSTDFMVVDNKALYANVPVGIGIQHVVEFDSFFLNENYFTKIGPGAYRTMIGGTYEVDLSLDDTVYGIENDSEPNYSKAVFIRVVSEVIPVAKEGTTTISPRLGDVVRIVVYVESPDRHKPYYEINGGSLKIYETDVSQVSFVEAFIDFKVADFIKEWTVRLCAFYVTDVEKKHIRFMTLDERLNAPRKNLSKYFLNRTRELYNIAGYARQNVFTINYHDDLLGKYADASFKLMNQTLVRNKDLFISLFTSELNCSSEYILSGNTKIQVPVIPMYDVKVTVTKKEDLAEQGDVKVDYEPLDTRFYVIKSYQAEQSIDIVGTTYSNVPIATTAGATLKYFIEEYWSNIGRILNAPLVQEVEFNLHAFNMNKIPLDEVVELEQEGSRYLVNRINYKYGGLVTAELIKIR